MRILFFCCLLLKASSFLMPAKTRKPPLSSLVILESSCKLYQWKIKIRFLPIDTFRVKTDFFKCSKLLVHLLTIFVSCICNCQTNTENIYFLTFLQNHHSEAYHTFLIYVCVPDIFSCSFGMILSVSPGFLVLSFQEHFPFKYIEFIVNASFWCGGADT